MTFQDLQELEINFLYTLARLKLSQVKWALESLPGDQILPIFKDARENISHLDDRFDAFVKACEETIFTPAETGVIDKKTIPPESVDALLGLTLIPIGAEVYIERGEDALLRCRVTDFCFKFEDILLPPPRKVKICYSLQVMSSGANYIAEEAELFVISKTPAVNSFAPYR